LSNFKNESDENDSDNDAEESKRNLMLGNSGDEGETDPLNSKNSDDIAEDRAHFHY
jgi:hypothetical protein